MEWGIISGVKQPTSCMSSSHTKWADTVNRQFRMFKIISKDFLLLSSLYPSLPSSLSLPVMFRKNQWQTCLWRLKLMLGLLHDGLLLLMDNIKIALIYQNSKCMQCQMIWKLTVSVTRVLQYFFSRPWPCFVPVQYSCTFARGGAGEAFEMVWPYNLHHKMNSNFSQVYLVFLFCMVGMKIQKYAKQLVLFILFALCTSLTDSKIISNKGFYETVFYNINL